MGDKYNDVKLCLIESEFEKLCKNRFKITIF